MVRDKNITEQAEVDAMAKAIEDAIDGLEKKPTESGESTNNPQTGDSSNLNLCVAIMVFSAGAIFIVLIANRRRKARK